MYHGQYKITLLRYEPTTLWQSFLIQIVGITPRNINKRILATAESSILCEEERRDSYELNSPVTFGGICNIVNKPVEFHDGTQQGKYCGILGMLEFLQNVAQHLTGSGLYYIKYEGLSTSTQQHVFFGLRIDGANGWYSFNRPLKTAHDILQAVEGIAKLQEVNALKQANDLHLQTMARFMLEDDPNAAPPWQPAANDHPLINAITGSPRAILYYNLSQPKYVSAAAAVVGLAVLAARTDFKNRLS